MRLHILSDCMPSAVMITHLNRLDLFPMVRQKSVHNAFGKYVEYLKFANNFLWMFKMFIMLFNLNDSLEATKRKPISERFTCFKVRTEIEIRQQLFVKWRSFPYDACRYIKIIAGNKMSIARVIQTISQSDMKTISPLNLVQKNIVIAWKKPTTFA